MNTQTTRGVFEPITTERMNAIMEHLYKDIRERLKENCYLHPVDFHRLLKEVCNQPYPEKLTVEGVDIFQDIDVPKGTFFMCTARMFEIYKTLVSHPWIDRSDPTIDLYKVASGLYDYELKNPPVDRFEPVNHLKIDDLKFRL